MLTFYTSPSTNPPGLINLQSTTSASAGHPAGSLEVRERSLRPTGSWNSLPPALTAGSQVNLLSNVSLRCYAASDAPCGHAGPLACYFLWSSQPQAGTVTGELQLLLRSSTFISASAAGRFHQRITADAGGPRLSPHRGFISVL